MEHDPTFDPQKNAAAIAEIARSVEHEQIAEKAAAKTKEALMEGLKAVFGQGDNFTDNQYNILVRRIPLICQDVKQINTDIADIKGNIKWAVRLVVGIVILAVLGNIIHVAIPSLPL